MTQKLEQLVEKGMRRKIFLDDFKKIERKRISKMDDKELAEWQSGYSPESPQYIISEHEWQRRLTDKQVKASRFAAYIGIIGVIAGSILTWLITKS